MNSNQRRRRRKKAKVGPKHNKSVNHNKTVRAVRAHFNKETK